MFELIVNFLLYFFTFLYLYKKEGGFTINVCCFLYISIIALFGILIYDTEYYMWGRFNPYGSHIRNDMSISPLLFVYAGFMIYFYAMKDLNSQTITKITPMSSWAENVIYYVNVLILIIIILSYKDAAFNVSDYLDAYNGEVSNIKVGYGLGKLGLWSLIVNTALSTSQVILPFYLLMKQNRLSYVKSIVFFILYFASAYVRGSAMGSRGVLFFAAIDVLFAFIFFYRMLDKRILRVLTIVAGCFSFIFVGVVLAISKDRFGDDLIFYICSYFGEPFINFPLILWNYPGFLHGDYLFSQMGFEEMGYLKVSLMYFRTLPGALYVDFGVIGSFLFLIVYSLYFKKILGKVSSNITMEKLLLYFFLFHGLEFGVFGFSVYGWSGYVILILNYYLFKMGNVNFVSRKHSNASLL